MKTKPMEVDEDTAGMIKELAERYRMEPRAVIERAVQDLCIWCRKREGELVWKDSTGKQMTMSL